MSGSVPNAPAPRDDTADRTARMGEEARRICHDINNSVGVLVGRAELMQMHLERGNTEGIRKGIEVILSQAERMKDLAKELRELRHRG